MNSENLPIVLPSEVSDKRGFSTWKSLMLCSTSKARSHLCLSQAEKFKVLPLGVHVDSQGDALLSVATAQKFSREDLLALSFSANAKIQTVYAQEAIVLQALFACYARQEVASNTSEFVPTILRQLVQSASADDASDIHLDAALGVVRVRFRVDGLLREKQERAISLPVFKELCRHIQVLCKVDSSFQRRPIEGSFTVNFSSRSLRIRASLFLQNDGGRVVLRILGPSLNCVSLGKGNSAFEDLGMSQLQSRVMRGFLGLNSGVIILAGPTGSGKSTLLYESLSYLQREERCIVTLEDPVERHIQGVSQTEIDSENGLDFKQYLKPLLRQDPDVIMVGEVRDAETAHMVLEAGITGHLILTTIHARTVIDVLIRLAEFGMSRQLIALSLRHLIAQSLVAKNCTQCRANYPVSKKFAEYFALEDDFVAVASTGCDVCGYSGVDGRVGVFETLTVNEIVKEYLLQADVSQYPHLLKDLGNVGALNLYTSRAKSIRDHLVSGLISPFFALQAVDIAPELFGISR